MKPIWSNRSRKTEIRDIKSGTWIADVGGETTQKAKEYATLMAASPQMFAALKDAAMMLAHLRAEQLSRCCDEDTTMLDATLIACNDAVNSTKSPQ